MAKNDLSFFSQFGNIIALVLKQNHQSLHNKHLPPVTMQGFGVLPTRSRRISVSEGSFSRSLAARLARRNGNQGELPCRLLGPSGKLPEKK